MDLSYILNELGEDREHYYNAVSPPIIQSSNFTFNTVAEIRHALADEFEGNLYSRGNNPTVDILRKKLAALDHAEDALIFSSGVAAITVPLLALLKSGDHVIAVKSGYSWTMRFFREFLSKFGVETTFVDGNIFQNFESAAQYNTKLIFLESPNTFTYELQDIKQVAAFAKTRNIITLIDNSYCSAIYQKPILHGIDLVCQSATKYIGGHSDVMAGVLTGSRQLIKQIFSNEFMNIGAVVSPHSAWLLLRGLRTLPLRLSRSYATTQIITEWLSNHNAVETVIWPFASTFPQKALAQQQMEGCGGLFSFTLKHSSFQKIEEFCNKLKHILLAVSWGGHESLVMPAISGISQNSYEQTNRHHQLIRMYVGLEDPAYLIDDLQQALSTV
ncbi:aminotransferase class I/II-fold pyridoxal phosphate-dependent enzyme [Mucilaginibacter sp. CSA2-8R]|uniref:trans-sulfuration enzyme family protein n=1 Tax=Mucilaginibacter sp. CSA2-8R TaxID=3141542 RepID=UPI00315CEAA6